MDNVNVDIEKITFQNEAPSTTDEFDSHGHDNTAAAVANVLKHKPNQNSIGVDGNLGGGKSTIIQLIESKCSNKFEFMTFDVDIFQHGSIKSAFIHFFSNEISKLNPGVEKDLTDIKSAKDKALGNEFSYKKLVKSSLSWYVIFFVLFSLVAVKHILPALLNAVETLVNIWKFDGTYTANVTLEATLTCLLGFSPFILISCLTRHHAFKWLLIDNWAAKQISKLKFLTFFSPIFNNWLGRFISGFNKHKDQRINVADLFNRNGEDTITETIEVTKEVGAIELRDAFKVFSNAIPDDLTVVLVIDNIDRISAEKIKEIWSDLEIFTSISHSKLRIIVPFDKHIVVDGLNSDNESSNSYEFIAKRLDVTFRAPPIVTAGWRNQFNKYFNETFEGNELSSANCTDILDAFDSLIKITPRFLKSHVNAIAATLMSNPTVKLSPVACSAYVLANDYFSGRVMSLINTSSDAFDVNTETQALMKVQQVLEKVIGSGWATQLMCIEYQTTENIAESEIITTPLAEAINSQNLDKVIDLEPIYGFDQYFSKAIDYSSVYDLIGTLSTFSDSDEHADFIEKWLPTINKKSLAESNEAHDYDAQYVEAIIHLQNSGYEPDLSIIQTSYDDFQLNYSEDELKPDEELAKQYLNEINLLSIALGATPDFIIENISIDTFVEYLWPNQDILPSLNIKDWKYFNLPSSKKLLLKNIVASKEGIDETNWLSKYATLSRTLLNNTRLGELIGNEGQMDTIDIEIEEYPQEEPPHLLTISNIWQSNTHNGEFYDKLCTVDEKYIPIWLACCYANFVSQDSALTVINSDNVSVTLIDSLLPFISKYPSYKEYVSEFLILTHRLAKMISNLKTGKAPVELNHQLVELLKKNKIQRLSIDGMIETDFSTITKGLGDEEASIVLDSIENRQSSDDIPNITEFDIHFVKAAAKNSKSWKVFISSLFDTWLQGDSFSFTKLSENSSLNYIANNYYGKSAKISEASGRRVCSYLLENLESLEDEGENVSNLFALVGARPRSKFLNELEVNISESHYTHQQKFAAIKLFGDFVQVASDDSDLFISNFTHLVANSPDEAIIINWLDTSKVKIDKWTEEQQRTLHDIVNGDDKFPTITENLNKLLPNTIESDESD